MKRFSDILMEIGTVIGIILVLYPLLSNYLYEKNQSEIAAYYQNLAEQMPSYKRIEMLERAHAYNKELLTESISPNDPFADSATVSGSEIYESLLNIGGDGVMGSIEAPGLIPPLLIYHGTQSDALQKGAGHLYGTSLPVGGIGTHCVISAHTGLSGKKMFTNLDRMELGDVFYLRILGEPLAYQVDSINTVLPYETDLIRIDPNEDYCTLVTCTPYGINSHRLLVRGTRIPYEEAEKIGKNQHKSVTTWLSMYMKSIIIGLIVALGTVLAIRLVKAYKKHNKIKEGDGHADNQKNT